MTEAAPSLMDDLEKAFDQHEQPDNENNNDNPPDEPPEAPAAETEPVVEEPAGDEPAGDTTEPEAKEEGGPEADAAEPAGDTETPEPEADSASEYKAPGKWKPDAREHWNALPPEVQREVAFREQKMEDTLRESAEARQLADQFQQTVMPFMPIMQAEGISDPMQGVQQLLGTASRLRMGDPQTKAAAIAGLVQAYGVDIQALDKALGGVAPQPAPIGQDQVDAMVQNAMQPYQQQQQSQTDAQIQTMMAEFGTKNEFFDDVKATMADIIEVGGRQGKQIGLQEAYDMACSMNPDIQNALKVRAEVADREATTRKAAEKQALANTSISGAQTHEKSSPTDTSIAGSLAHAWDEHVSGG